MELDEDQVLIQKVLEGNKSSFEQLMRKYNRKIYNFIFRMVRDKEITNELTQDFFIKIFSVINKYNFEYKFSTWACRICYNLVIDYIRRNQMKLDSLDNPNLSPKQMINSDNYVSQDGFYNLDREELKNYVWKVVEQIPSKYRELVLLRYLQEMKYEEIAQITSLPVGTVKNRIFKAKEILRSEMEKDGLFK